MYTYKYIYIYTYTYTYLNIYQNQLDANYHYVIHHQKPSKLLRPWSLGVRLFGIHQQPIKGRRQAPAAAVALIVQDFDGLAVQNSEVGKSLSDACLTVDLGFFKKVRYR